MIHLYLAAPFSSKKRLKEYAKILEEKNRFRIVSRWIWESSKNELDYPLEAARDFKDLNSCDIFIQFSSLEQERSKGGMHVELGYALAKEKTCIIFGQKSHIFHWHPAILHTPTFDELLEFLRGLYESK